MERRQFPRKEMRVAVVCCPADGAGGMMTARSEDISLGGIGLSLDRPLDAGTDISMKIFRSFWEKPLEAKGKVAWHDESGKNGKHRAGVQFTEVPWSGITSLLDSR